jgi:hypothetical protein
LNNIFLPFIKWKISNITQVLFLSHAFPSSTNNNSLSTIAKSKDLLLILDACML